MLSKMSVRKPYTVVVAIVLVIILGVVSFTKMHTDLLPSMNLPYAIVMTTYQGASPETVETVVTRPIEQSMATVSDIENISSQSRENVSVVILEFQEATNMDSVTIEIREKLDQISGYWDDSVGKPTIMKLNPDMLPIMIAAVEVDGMEDTEVTDYVKNKIAAEIESVAGVASVSTTGTITESVEVLIREQKIQEVNKKVEDALTEQFKEKEKELEDAQNELNEGKSALEEGKAQLESGQAQLDDGTNALVNGIAAGESKIYDAEAEMNSGLEELKNQNALLDEQQTKLDDGRTQINNGIATAQAGLTLIEEMESRVSQLREQYNTLSENAEELRSGLEELETQNEEVEDDIEYYQGILDDEESTEEEMNNAQIQLDILNAQLAANNVQITMTNSGIEEAESGMTAIETSLDLIAAGLGAESADEIDDSIAAQKENVNGTIDELNGKLTELDTAQEQLNAGREQLETYRQQILAGQTQLTAGKIELTTQQILASIQLSAAQAKMDLGSLQIAQNESKLEEAQSQLDSGKETLENAKKDAIDQAKPEGILTVETVKGILAGENFSMPAGYLQEGKDEYLVRVGDKFEDTDSLENLVLLDLGIDGLDQIRLKDVADVNRQNDSDKVYARLNGQPGVMLTIEKQTGYSTGDVSDRLLKRIEEIQEEHPDVHFSILMDQGIYIDLVVDSVMQNMLYGAVLAIIVLFLFMKSIKPTLVIACSIPISVVAAVVMMYFSGVTLNIISLSGLALGIGMLVDNSIVVIENIDRLRQLGVPAKKAAVEGARQVAGAIAASTLTTVCVFAPIVFTEGITRQLFVDMGLTIAYSLMASLLVALTLVPMMSAGLLRKSKPKKYILMDAIKNAYGFLLKGALHVKLLVILLAVGLLVLSGKKAIEQGTAFMPEMESTQATVTVTGEKGGTFSELCTAADEVIAKIEDIDDIEAIGAMAGGSGLSSMMGSGSGQSNSVTMYLVLSKEKVLSGAQLEEEILERTENIPCTVEVSTQTMDMSALGGSGITIQIKGNDLDKLAAISKDFGEIVSAVPGTEGVSDGQDEVDREYRVIVDKTKAMEHKLTVAQVFQDVYGKLADATSATTLSTDEKDYQVFVRDESDEKMTLRDLREMEFEDTNSEGEKETYKLSDIASFQEAEGPQTITRTAQSRYMTVSTGIANGYNIGLVSNEIKKQLDEYTMPAGYSYEMTGEDKSINDAMKQLLLMLVLAVVFMYLIMVAQFQSLLSPFIIMFTIPLAFTGGFMGLLIAKMEVSVIAMIGFIMLSGIIVNNGIVLVDYTNQLRADGMSKKEALIQAGKDRLRPIIMTALTTILGLSTMALGNGMGSDMVQPMAIVTIGGLIYGTLLTLFVVPCIYDLLNRKKYKKYDDIDE